MKFLLILLSLITFNLYAQENCVAVTKDNLCIEIQWKNNIELGKYLANTVRFKDLNLSNDDQTVYVSPKHTIKFYGWMIMQHHEHGTRPVKTNEVAPGVFENSEIFYMKGMKGSWQFKVKVGDEDFVLHSLNV